MLFLMVALGKRPFSYFLRFFLPYLFGTYRTMKTGLILLYRAICPKEDIWPDCVVCVCFLTCNIYFSPIPLFKIFGLHIYPPAYLYKLRNFQVNKHILIILYIFLYIIVLDLPAAISNCQIWHNMFFKTNHSFTCCSVYVCFENVWKLEWKHYCNT